MKALSIQQPWADMILYHGKDIENRTWRLPRWMVGQRIYVHAGKRVDWDAPGEWRVTSERLGAILGEVTITGCVTDSPSHWFCGPYGFTLADPVAYENPRPCRGGLGFFVPEGGRSATWGAQERRVRVQTVDTPDKRGASNEPS